MLSESIVGGKLMYYSVDQCCLQGSCCCQRCVLCHGQLCKVEIQIQLSGSSMWNVKQTNRHGLSLMIDNGRSSCQSHSVVCSQQWTCTEHCQWSTTAVPFRNCLCRVLQLLCSAFFEKQCIYIDKYIQQHRPASFGYQHNAYSITSGVKSSRPKWPGSFGLGLKVLALAWPWSHCLIM